MSSSSVCRGYLAKKKYKELVDEKNKAATKIQARYRGHKERKSFKRKQYEKQEIYTLTAEKKDGRLFFLTDVPILFVGKPKRKRKQRRPLKKKKRLLNQRRSPMKKTHLPPTTK